MTTFQQVPIFSDVCRPYFYVVKQTPTQNNVQITVAGGSAQGSLTLKPDSYFLAYGFSVFTNYDNVAPVIATTTSNALLGRPFIANNFNCSIQRGNSNTYGNFPIPQAHLCGNGYRSGKLFPNPIVYGPRSNFFFTFQDTTGLFLLTALSGGTAVPLTIQMYLCGYNIPVTQWNKFAAVYPSFAKIFGAPPSLV